MKILIFGPKARYDLYLPEFVRDLPVELVFSGTHQSTLQAAEENQILQNCKSFFRTLWYTRLDILYYQRFPPQLGEEGGCHGRKTGPPG